MRVRWARQGAVRARAQRPDGSTAWAPAVVFPKEHADDIHTLLVASSSKFLVTAAAGPTSPPRRMWPALGA